MLVVKCISNRSICLFFPCRLLVIINMLVIRDESEKNHCRNEKKKNYVGIKSFVLLLILVQCFR